MNSLFDTSVTDRIIVTYDKKAGKFTASVRLVGAAEGYGTYSSGSTPEIALERALESASLPQRWRKLRF
jgi:hypothetical protein